MSVVASLGGLYLCAGVAMEIEVRLSGVVGRMCLWQS